MRIQVQIDYIVQETSDEVKARFPEASGTKDWEVLDQDGDRYCFADSEVDAVDQLSSFIGEMLASMNFGLVKFTNDDDGE